MRFKRLVTSLVSVVLLSSGAAAATIGSFAGNGVAGFADSVGTAAKFYYPAGVATDAGGNLYVADEYNNRIRKISPAGVVSTLADSATSGNTDGSGAAAQFNFPAGVAVDSSGNVYVAGYLDQKIRKISPAGVTSTIVSFANTTKAQPWGIAVGPDGLSI
jgi:streptogramin lyase